MIPHSNSPLSFFSEHNYPLGPNSIIPKYSLIQYELHHQLQEQMQQVQVLLSILREEMYDNVLELMSQMDWGIGKAIEEHNGSEHAVDGPISLEEHVLQNHSPLANILSWIAQIKLYILWKLGRYRDIVGLLNGDADETLNAADALEQDNAEIEHSQPVVVPIRLISFLPPHTKLFYESIIQKQYFKWEDARSTLEFLAKNCEMELSHTSQSLLDMSQNQDQDYIQVSTDEHDDLLIFQRARKIDTFLALAKLYLDLNHLTKAKEYIDLSLRYFTSLSYYNGMVEARSYALLYYIKRKYQVGNGGGGAQVDCFLWNVDRLRMRTDSQHQREDPSGSSHHDDFDQRIEHQIREINALIKTDMVGTREKSFYWFFRGVSESDLIKQREYLKISLNLQKDLGQQDLVAETMFRIARSLERSGDAERCISILKSLSQSADLSIDLRIKISIRLARLEMRTQSAGGCLIRLHQSLRLLHFSLQQQNLPLSSVVSRKTDSFFGKIFTLLRDFYVDRRGERSQMDLKKALFYDDLIKELQRPRIREKLYGAGKCSSVENHEQNAGLRHLMKAVNIAQKDVLQFSFVGDDLYVWFVQGRKISPHEGEGGQNGQPRLFQKRNVVPRLRALTTQIARNVARLRDYSEDLEKGLSDEIRHLADVRTELEELYELMLGGDVNALLEEVDQDGGLIIIPPDAQSAHHLHFEMLLHNGLYLCERFEMSILPSLHSLHERMFEATLMESAQERPQSRASTEGSDGSSRKHSSRSSSRASSRGSSRAVGGAKSSAFVMIATELHAHHNNLLGFVEQEVPQFAPRTQSIKKLKAFLCKYHTKKLYIAADCNIEVPWKWWLTDELITQCNIIQVSREASEHYAALQFRVSPNAMDDGPVLRHELLLVPFLVNPVPLWQMLERCQYLIGNSFSLLCAHEIREEIVTEFFHHHFGSKGELKRPKSVASAMHFAWKSVLRVERELPLRELPLLLAGLHVLGVDFAARKD
mmetsp:Transcript_6380/g.23994  ORF Transcript_6380/g.23994 Transcript_6380/m.23994 type:complete len:988 (-) Transcript_6380:142-3105(-)